MAHENYWGSQTVIDPFEGLNQQGLVFRADHRQLAVPDNGSMDYMIEVLSSCHVDFEFKTTGVVHGSFVEVGSITVSAGNSSIDRWNDNTFFQAVNSGMPSTSVTHTASYAATANRGDFILGAGGSKQQPIGGAHGDDLILGPGIYAFQLQNKSGGAIDFMFQMVWEEPEVPNVPGA